MGLLLTATIEGEQLLSRRLQGLSADLADLQKPLQDSAGMLTEFFSGEVFDTEGSAIGYPWEPLAVSTLAQKLHLGFPETPLVRTGRMRDSFESEITTNQAVITNSAPYFVYHQSNQARKGRLPRRVMMALDEQRREQIVKIFQSYIQSLMNKRV